MIALRFLLLLLILAVPAQLASSQESPKQFTREELIDAARETMAASRYCALITLDSSGRTQARTVDPFTPDENMIVWIGTNPRTRKVSEIRRNPRVTLYYFDKESQAYVTISGTARLVNSASEKARHWKSEWETFYPDRAKDFLLIAVTPLKLEIVNVTKGIVGDPHAWRPPSVTFQTTRRKHK